MSCSNHNQLKNKCDIALHPCCGRSREEDFIQGCPWVNPQMICNLGHLQTQYVGLKAVHKSHSFWVVCENHLWEMNLSWTWIVSHSSKWNRVKLNIVCMGCIWGIEWKNQYDFLDLMCLRALGNNSSQTRSHGETSPGGLWVITVCNKVYNHKLDQIKRAPTSNMLMRNTRAPCIANSFGRAVQSIYEWCLALSLGEHLLFVCKSILCILVCCVGYRRSQLVHTLFFALFCTYIYLEWLTVSILAVQHLELSFSNVPQPAWAPSSALYTSYALYFNCISLAFRLNHSILQF